MDGNPALRICKIIIRMKNHRILLAALALCGSLTASRAQDEMKPVWTLKPDHGLNFTGTDEEGGKFVSVASQKTITVINAADGTERWTKKFTDIAPKLRKIDDIEYLWDAEIILAFDRKMGKDQIAAIDMNTGNALWSTDQFQDVGDGHVVFVPEKKAFSVMTKKLMYFVDAQTGKVLWETPKFKSLVGKYLYDPKEDAFVMLNYKPTYLGAIFAGLKNQIIKMKASTGEVLWEQDYRGLFEKKIVTREALAKLDLDNGMVRLDLNGIQMYDYATGAKVWSNAYDETPAMVRKPMGVERFGAYGTVANPLFDGAFVYVLDCRKRGSQYLKKHEIATGKEVWKSEEIKDAKVLPNMFLKDGVVILQVGGTIEKQWFDRKRNADGGFTEEWMVDFDEYGPYNVQAFSAEDGKQLWQSERFKKGITNVVLAGKDLVVCSGKALYRLDVKTGAETYETPLGPDNVGKASYIESFGDGQVAVVGEKGVSTHNAADGKLLKASKYKKSAPLFRGSKAIHSNSLTMKNQNGDFAVYDVENCQYKKYDGRKDARAIMSFDGKRLFVYEDGSMLRSSKVTCLATR